MSKQKMLAAGCLLAAVVPAPAAPRTVGTAMARGTFRLDGATVTGNATVLEGSALETAGVASTVRLSQGGAVTLGGGAKVTLFGDHLVLERGVGQVSGTTGYPIDAQKLRVQPAEGSQARVKIDDDQKIIVAAMNGPVRVTTTGGVILANVAAGEALAFAPQGGAVGATSVRGTLTKSGASYLLRDRTSNVTFQVTGCEDFAGKLNKMVSVTGVMLPEAHPASGASQVLQANCGNITLAAGGLGAGAAASVGAGAAKMPAAASSLLGAHSTAIITGVVVAAAGVGVGLGVQLSQQDSTTSR